MIILKLYRTLLDNNNGKQKKPGTSSWLFWSDQLFNRQILFRDQEYSLSQHRSHTHIHMTRHQSLFPR